MWVVGLVAGIVLLFILLLAVPVDVSFSLERDGSFSLRARVGWMFGLIGKNIGGKKRKKTVEKAKERKTTRRRGSVRSLLAVLTTEGFPQKLYGLIREILRIVKIRELKASFRIGLGDAAETGMLFAVLAPAMVFVRAYSSAEVQLEPDFEQERLEGYCKGDVRAVPIKFVKAFVPFVFSWTTMRAMRAMLRARRK